jgi:uncharacterized membrane protein YoaK (UPF0700 family)
MDPVHSKLETPAAVLLAATGGYGDAASYLLVHCFTGHVTGNSVLAMVGLATPAGHSWEPILAVGCFLMATAIAQRMRSRGAQGLGGAHFRYVLLVEIVLLSLGPLLFNVHAALLIAAMCLSLGLQNGALSQTEGIGLHTTYLSGTLTHFVQSLVRPRDPGTASRERRVILVIAGGFLAGALCGGLAITHVGPGGIWGMPVLLLAVLGLSLSSQASRASRQA